MAIAADGAVLVSDTRNHRVLRIDPSGGGVTTWAQLATPGGMDVAADGTVYMVEASTNRVLHLDPSGTKLGVVGPMFDDPYDVDLGPGGSVYVVESLQSGRVKRIAADGKVTTLSRS